MRFHLRSLPATLLIIAVCCGFVGCKSNGGRWYKPSTYSLHNPFKRSVSETDEFGQYADHSPESTSPRSGLTPEISPPPDGYSSDRAGTALAANNTASRSASGSSTSSAAATTPSRSSVGSANSTYGGSSSVAMNQPASFNQPSHNQSSTSSSVSGYDPNGGDPSSTAASANSQYGAAPYNNQYNSQNNASPASYTQQPAQQPAQNGNTSYAAPQQYPNNGAQNYGAQNNGMQNNVPNNVQNTAAANGYGYTQTPPSGAYGQSAGQSSAGVSGYDTYGAAANTQQYGTQSGYSNQGYDNYNTNEFQPGSRF